MNTTISFADHLGAIILAPFIVVSAFFGLGNHATTPYIASSTVWTATSTTWNTHATSTTHTATSTGIYLPGSNGGVKLPPGVTPGGPIIPYHTPTITSEFPSSGAVGSLVTLSGSGFASHSIVHFAAGAVQNTTVSTDGTKLTFTIPSSLGAYCRPDQACPMYMMLVNNGTYKLYVENVPATGDAAGPTSNTVDFTVTGSARVGI